MKYGIFRKNDKLVLLPVCCRKLTWLQRRTRRRRCRQKKEEKWLSSQFTQPNEWIACCCDRIPLLLLCNNTFFIKVKEKYTQLYFHWLRGNLDITKYIKGKRSEKDANEKKPKNWQMTEMKWGQKHSVCLTNTSWLVL